MQPLLLLLSIAPARADIAIEPPTDQQFLTWSIRVEGLEAAPGSVVVAWETPYEGKITGYRALSAASPEAELYHGGSRRPGLASPDLYLLPTAAFETWQAATREEIDRQEAACADRGEGCMHISRFVPHFAPPTGGIDCATKAKLTESGPTNSPPTRLLTFHLDEASATTCKLSPVGQEKEAAPKATGGCTSAGGSALSLLAGFAMLVGLSRRVRGG